MDDEIYFGAVVALQACGDKPAVIFAEAYQSEAACEVSSSCTVLSLPGDQSSPQRLRAATGGTDGLPREPRGAGP